jgi:ankyrin repeat protein
MLDLRLLLEASTSELNTEDAHGRTPLWSAVNRGSLAIVSAVLQHAASASINDAEGFSPTHVAAVKGNPRHHRRPSQTRRPALHVEREATPPAAAGVLAP